MNEPKNPYDIPSNSRAAITDILPRVNLAALIFLAALLALGFIALAILGSGGWAQFARNPLRPAVAIALLLFAAATPICGCHISPAIEQDRSNDWIFPLLLAMGLLMGWLSAYCDQHNRWTIGSSAIRYAGLIAFLAGVALRLAAIRTLGQRFTVWVAIQQDHQLETSGLYRWVRHPSYTGAILNLVGWAMVFRSLAGILLAIAMSQLLITRITPEETLLKNTFGHAYTAYQKRSWKLLPFVF